jgi:hypothetical protein
MRLANNCLYIVLVCPILSGCRRNFLRSVSLSEALSPNPLLSCPHPLCLACGNHNLYEEGREVMPVLVVLHYRVREQSIWRQLIQSLKRQFQEIFFSYHQSKSKDFSLQWTSKSIKSCVKRKMTNVSQ